MAAFRTVFGVLGATVIAVACSSTAKNEPSNQGPQEPGPGGLVDDGGGIAPAVKPTDAATTSDADALAPCEELGDLRAGGLLASYDATSRWFSGAVTGRPVLTELSVVGVGTPADIQGTLVALGVGANANYATCTHCMLVLVGCTSSDCNSAKTYFAEAGNAYFNQVSTGPGQPFVGQFADVTLREVTIDTALTSTNVAGGSCLHLSSFAFTAMTAAVATTTDAGTDAGGSSSGGGSTGSPGRGSGRAGTLSPPPIQAQSPEGGAIAPTGDGGCANIDESCSSATCCYPGLCNLMTQTCALPSVPGGA